MVNSLINWINPIDMNFIKWAAEMPQFSANVSLCGCAGVRDRAKGRVHREERAAELF
jgi:hypothetical protein